MRKRVFAIGVTSKCEDGKHTIFIDVDDPIGEKALDGMILDYAMKNGLSFCLFSRTPNGYHVIFLDKLDEDRAFEIYPEWGDKIHWELSVVRKKYVLEVKNWKFKMKVWKIKNELSFAHWLFFSRFLPYEKRRKYDNLVEWDRRRKIEIQVFTRLYKGGVNGD